MGTVDKLKVTQGGAGVGNGTQPPPGIRGNREKNIQSSGGKCLVDVRGQRSE